MGQKVNPTAFRLGYIRDWQSRWYAPRKQTYLDWLGEDLRIRDHIKKKFFHAGIDRVKIERASNRVKITVHTARPGIIIGRKGSEIDSLRRALEEMTGKAIILNIEEVKPPDLYSQLVAENISGQLLRRMGFRRVLKKTGEAIIKAGALGVKIQVSGRLGGSEMSRTEWKKLGRVPLHTLRADIDYGLAEARTKYGVIGIKVWIFRKEVFPRKDEVLRDLTA
jgi:small subunit ribosomal protein S3